MHPFLSCKYFLVSDQRPNLRPREWATKREKVWSMFCKTLKNQPEVIVSALKKTKQTINYSSSESLEVKHLFLQVRTGLLCSVFTEGPEKNR